MRFIFIAGLLLAPGVLSSCYTDYNQTLLKPHRVYEGWTLDYETKGNLFGEKTAPLLPQVIYRAGDEWYIAGHKAEYTADPWSATHLIGDAQEELRHMLSLSTRGAVHYHRITPRLAELLLKPFGDTRICIDLLRENLKQAGGVWLPALPEGAVPVEVPYFHASNRVLHWDIIDGYRASVPWYKYPLAGLVLVGVDIPLSVLSNVGFALSMPIVLPLGTWAVQEKGFYDYSGDTRVWIRDDETKAMRLMTPADIGKKVVYE